MLARLRSWAKRFKREVRVLWLAARDPRVPLARKLMAGVVAAYALSPIDLIPDFIPVLRLLDDLLIVPAGIWLVLRLLPDDLLEDLRTREAEGAPIGPSASGAAAIVAIWLLAAIAAGLWLWR